MRQKSPLPCPGAGGVYFAGGEVLHRDFCKGQGGWRNERRFTLLLSEQRLVCYCSLDFLPFRFNIKLLLNRQISLRKESIYLFGYYFVVVGRNTI